MYVDGDLLLSNAQAVTTTAATTNYLPLGGAFFIGRGEPVAMVVTVDVAADFTTGNETYAFSIETDDNTSFSSATTLASRTIAAGSLTAGSLHVVPFPYTNERYIQGRITTGGTTPTITVTIDIKPMSMIDSSGAYYPSGFTITW